MKHKNSKKITRRETEARLYRIWGGMMASSGRLTDLYISPEALEDVLNWGVE